MITDERMSEALEFLSSSDDEAAELRTDAERAEFKARAVRDAVFLHETGTVAERTAKAGNSDHYKDAMQDYYAKLELAERIRNRRNTAELIIRAWQTVSSNRRQGQI